MKKGNTVIPLVGRRLQRLKLSRRLACQSLQRNGDLLVIGKKHYGDGLYQEVARILECSEGDLRNMKSLAERFPLSVRTDKLSWRHHYEVSSIKKTEIVETGSDK